MILNISGRTDIVAFYSNWLKMYTKNSHFYVEYDLYHYHLIKKLAIENVWYYLYKKVFFN